MSGFHGSVRGLSLKVNTSSIAEGRFGRMFRWLPRETYSRADLLKLAEEMIQFEHAQLREAKDGAPDAEHRVSEGPDVLYKNETPLDTAFGEAESADENPMIPAGYTYFGQFIDHDLTFDPNSSLQRLNDPDATEDFRTPRLDLDSLYGRGPDDQPYLYKDKEADGSGGILFLLGRAGDSVRPGELPRNEDGRALIGDPRNDENGIVCQVQALFLNFHNKVVDNMLVARPQLNRHEIFVESQRIVRWHYQYIVLNDYLRKVVGESTWKKVFMGGGDQSADPKIEFYLPKGGKAYMPVEFSVAAFRFGHSMIRPSYALRAGEEAVGGSESKRFLGDPDGRFNRVPIFSDVHRPKADLSGFGELPEDWEIDWNLFFAKGNMPTAPDTDGILAVDRQIGNHLTQPGYRIDTKLVDPLAMLPPKVAKSGNMPDFIPVLAYRNLIRGSEFELPSGQSVARALNEPVMSEFDLWESAKNTDFKDPKTNPFAFKAPLWFYILREAERNSRSAKDKLAGHHLGPVGGRIVAEVLVGIALNDHTSYLYQDAKWTPEGEAARSGFSPNAPLTTMFELIHWTTDGKMTFRK